MSERLDGEQLERLSVSLEGSSKGLAWLDSVRLLHECAQCQIERDEARARAAHWQMVAEALGDLCREAGLVPRQEGEP